MALLDFTFFPGIDNKTTVGAEQRWVDCDNVSLDIYYQKKLAVGRH